MGSSATFWTLCVILQLCIVSINPIQVQAVRRDRASASALASASLNGQFINQGANPPAPAKPAGKKAHGPTVIFDFPPGYFRGTQGQSFRLINPNIHPNNPLNLNPFQPNLPQMGVVENSIPNEVDYPDTRPVGVNQFGGMRFAQHSEATPYSFVVDKCTNCDFETMPAPTQSQSTPL